MLSNLVRVVGTAISRKTEAKCVALSGARVDELPMMVGSKIDLVLLANGGAVRPLVEVVEIDDDETVLIEPETDLVLVGKELPDAWEPLAEVRAATELAMVVGESGEIQVARHEHPELIMLGLPKQLSR